MNLFQQQVQASTNASLSRWRVGNTKAWCDRWMSRRQATKSTVTTTKPLSSSKWKDNLINSMRIENHQAVGWNSKDRWFRLERTLPRSIKLRKEELSQIQNYGGETQAGEIRKYSQWMETLKSKLPQDK